MSRFRNYGQKDDPWTLDGDRGFKGIWMARTTNGEDRSAIPPGYLARNENRRLIDGASCTRSGKSIPLDFNPAYANTMVGSDIFSNPNLDQVMLIATSAASYTWALGFGKDPVQIPIDGTDPDGTVGTGIVHFTQAFDKVLMHRIPSGGLPPLVWDGDNTHKWLPVLTPPPPPAIIIPSTWAGTPFQNRLILYNPYWAPVPWRNQFIITYPLQYDRYDFVLETFRISAALSDVITSIRPYFKGAVVVFMRDSVNLVQDFEPDPMATTQRVLNDRLGSEGIYGPLFDGEDYIFLSRSGNGFYRLKEVDMENIQAPPIPISRKIQPVIDRIDWPRAFLYTCSAVLGERGYFALPLDKVSGAANGMVVYNMVLREWESGPDFWDDPTMRINRLHVTLYDGQSRLFAMDYAAKAVYLLEDGLDDQGTTGIFPVHDRFASRGFDANNPGSFKRFERALLAIRTFNPNAIVTAVGDGVNERKPIATVSKDKSQFYPHGMAPFDPLTGDPTLSKRQDYADAATNSAIEDFEELPVGTIYYVPGTATSFDPVMQQSLERPQIRQNARWLSIEIENTQGRLDVLGAGVDGIPTGEGVKTIA